MVKFVIRLDDACPQMNIDKWNEMEQILDEANIQPIVGVIPDNKDSSFGNDSDEGFWEKCLAWQNKNWTIAQHGLHHTLHDYPCKDYFQLAIETETEMAGNSLERQIEMVEEGKHILESKGIYPVCFFAPCHTFDKATVEAIEHVGGYQFISDGYAFRLYRKGAGIFLPAIFDTPHAIMGIQTFVFHPSKMKNSEFEYLKQFIQMHRSDFVNAVEYISAQKQIKKQGFVGRCIEVIMFILRTIRKVRDNDNGEK